MIRAEQKHLKALFHLYYYLRRKNSNFTKAKSCFPIVSLTYWRGKQLVKNSGMNVFDRKTGRRDLKNGRYFKIYLDAPLLWLLLLLSCETDGNLEIINELCSPSNNCMQQIKYHFKTSVLNQKLSKPLLQKIYTQT